MCELARSTGFLQGWSYTVAHAQSCRWVEIGSLAPVRDFLCGVIECSLRLFGPASEERQLALSPSRTADGTCSRPLRGAKDAPSPSYCRAGLFLQAFSVDWKLCCARSHRA